MWRQTLTYRWGEAALILFTGVVILCGFVFAYMRRPSAPSLLCFMITTLVPTALGALLMLRMLHELALVVAFSSSDAVGMMQYVGETVVIGCFSVAVSIGTAMLGLLAASLHWWQQRRGTKSGKEGVIRSP